MNDNLKRVPRRVSEGLTFGQDALPEYAGTIQRVVETWVETESGKPARILDANGSYWTFDDKGRIDIGLRESMRGAMDIAFSDKPRTEGKVVDLRPEIKKRQWRSEHRWDVTGELLDRIAADVWPGPGAALSLEVVKGKAPKRPPVTYEAKNLIADISSRLSMISFDIDRLTEPGLKGFAFAARDRAASETEARAIWEGVAAEADRLREIKARRRTGKGVWYAVLHVWRRVRPGEMHELDTVEVRCKGAKAAAIAAQQLLRDHAHRFSEDVTLEAELLSDLE